MAEIQAYFSEHMVEVVIAGWAAVVLLGIGLGLSKKMVVYRTYKDLVLVFAATFFAVAGVMIKTMMQGDQGPTLFMYISFLLAAILLVVVMFKTFVDNRFFLFPIALVTKISLSVLYLAMVMEVVSPSGKGAVNRRTNQGGVLVVLAILTPLVRALVKNR